MQARKFVNIRFFRDFILLVVRTHRTYILWRSAMLWHRKLHVNSLEFMHVFSIP